MLNDILRPEGNNMPGALTLEYCSIWGFFAFPYPVANVVSSAPTFTAGYRWFKIEITEGRLEWQEETSDTDNGSVTKINIKGFVRGDNAELRAQFALMSQLNAFVVKCKDGNGLTRLAGTTEQYLEFSKRFTTTGLRGYSFEFTGQLTTEPPIYTA